MNTNTHQATPESTRPTTPSHRRSHSDPFLYDDEEDDDSIFDIEKCTFSDLDVMSSDSNDSELSYIPPPHLRSLSVDSAFFEGLFFDGNEERRGHWRTSSMDGGEDELKLAELALADTRRARRILANRQSAARSKEKKMKFTTELEKEVQALQTESANRATEVTLLEKDVTSLTAENRELKLHLQALEEQEKLRAAMKESLRNDIDRLKMELGLPITNNGSAGSEVIGQFPPEIQNLLQQQQPQMPNQNQASTSQMPLNPNFLDFNRRP